MAGFIVRQSSMWLTSPASEVNQTGNSHGSTEQQEPLLREQTDDEAEGGEADFVDTSDRRIEVPEEPDSSQEWGEELPVGWFSWQRLWKFTGPGFLMSIAYLVGAPSSPSRTDASLCIASSKCKFSQSGLGYL